MTLQHSYGTNGISDAFAFSFPIDQEADIQVLIDNVEQNSGFTVHGAASPGGGVVVFLAAPSAGKTLLIRHRGRSAVTSADASAGYLSDKLVAGTGISLTPQTDGEGRQVLVVANTEETSDLYLKKDATPQEIAAFLVEYGVATNTLDNVDRETGRTRLEVLSEQDSDNRYAKKVPAGSEANDFRAQYQVAKTDLSNVDPVVALARIGAQAHDANLDWLASNITNAGKALLDDASPAAQRTTLGLADVAYLNVAQDWTQPQRNQARFTGSVGGSVVLDMATKQNFELELSADVTFADPIIAPALELDPALVGQRGSIGIVPNGFAITAMGNMWKRVGDTGAPGEITGQGRIDYHIRSTSRIEYAYNDVEA